MIGLPVLSLKITSIFIHIPRTAGTAIKWALNDRIHDLEYINAQDHRLATERMSELGNLWNQAYKFTLVRNPWERAVSWYHRRGITDPFEQWILEADVSQAQYFMDDDDVLVDDVFQYEDLPDILSTIFARASWPKFTKFHRVNDTIHKHYSAYYNQTTCDIVAQRDRWVIDTFGYEFDRI